nr:hypothetical protein [uncultured Desulfobacter sp.]
MSFFHQSANLTIDKLGGFFTIISFFLALNAEVHELLPFAVGERPDIIAHAELADHGTGNFTRSFQIVLSPAINITKIDLFGYPSAK